MYRKLNKQLRELNGWLIVWRYGTPLLIWLIKVADCNVGMLGSSANLHYRNINWFSLVLLAHDGKYSWISFLTTHSFHTAVFHFQSENNSPTCKLRVALVKEKYLLKKWEKLWFSALNILYKGFYPVAIGLLASKTQLRQLRRNWEIFRDWEILTQNLRTKSPRILYFYINC